MRKTLLAILTAVSTHLFAGVGCEDTFKKSGTPLTGTRYSAVVAVDGLSVADAIGQLHGIAVNKKLDILTEDAANGNMLLEDRAGFRHKAIPYVISVTESGGSARVQVMVKLNKGALAKADDVKAEICSILAGLRGGEEGQAAAARGLAQTGSSEARKVDALVLSMELARETQESAASIPLRYKSRRFTVSGKVEYVIKDGDAYRVAYDIPEPRDMPIKPGPRDPHFKIDIHCLMSPEQTAWAIALRPGERVKLTGSYSNYDQFRRSIWLEGCKPE